MAQLFSRIGASPLGRAGLASFSILAIVGVASQILPLTCLSAGVSGCTVELAAETAAPLDSPAGSLQVSPTAELSAVPAAPEDATKVAALSPGKPQPAELSSGSVQVSPNGLPRTNALLEQAPLPTLTQNDLVAATFQALKVELTSQPADLTTRKVKTITINADGTPVFPAEAAAPVVETQMAEVGAGDVAPSPGPSPQGEGVQDEAPAQVAVAATPSAPVSAVEPTSREESSPVSAYAPANGDSAVVTGKGANVRSAPNKGKGGVLFALEGGAEVTVVQMNRGWAKVVDKQGRSGWVYGEYLDRG